jgi:hypothetical protein
LKKEHETMSGKHEASGTIPPPEKGTYLIILQQIGGGQLLSIKWLSSCLSSSLQELTYKKLISTKKQHPFTGALINSKSYEG